MGKRFAAFWSTQVLAKFSGKTALMMLPLIAITRYHASPGQVGYLNALQYMPVILIAGTLGGVFDHWDRRVCLMTAYLLNGAGLVLVPAFAQTTARFQILLLVCFVTGCFVAFTDLGAQTIPPDLVLPARLVEANGWLELLNSGCTIVAPGLAGIALDAIGDSSAVLLCAVISGCAGLLMVTVRPDHRVRRARPASPRLFGALAEGMRKLFADPVLRVTSVQAAIFNLFEQAITTIYLIYAVRVWGFSAGLVGLTIAIGGAGTLLAPVLVTATRSRATALQMLNVGMGMAALGPLVLLAASGTHADQFVLATAAFGLYSFGLTLYNIHAVSLRQARAPADALGSVSAAYRFIAFGPIGIGAILGGLTAAQIGLRSALVGATVLLAMSFVLFVVRIRKLSDSLSGLPQGL